MATTLFETLTLTVDTSNVVLYGEILPFGSG